MSVGRRIRLFRQHRRWTQKQLAEKINVSPQVISNWEREYTTPDSEDITKLSETFSVTADDILVGSRVMVPIGEWLDIQLKKNPDIIPTGDIRYIRIVAEIPCGTPIFTEDNVIGTYPIDTSFVKLNGGDYVWIRAKGDSMIEAGITDGSLVLIRLQPEVESGEIAAVCVDQENATLKRVMFADGVVILMPANPDMKPQSYLAERIRIVGKVMKILTDPK